MESDSILLLLNQRGIAASSGAACASGSIEPSHVLRAMKVPFNWLHGAVRFSLSRETAAEDVDRVVEAMPEIVEQLRRPLPEATNTDLYQGVYA
jgi:cysteine desulfurase